MQPETLFVKLGGSLITDKSSPRTPHPGRIRRLAGEIRHFLDDRPRVRLVLGHGSGSFGHVPASEHGTRAGVRGPEGWRGFLEVWRQAGALNRIVMDALDEAGLPAIAFPPSGSAVAFEGRIAAWPPEPFERALDAGLIPVVYGDTVFDRAWGGTIQSTEELFAHLAHSLRPARILLAGVEGGVFADYPANTRPIEKITPQEPGGAGAAGSSVDRDVTGGMRTKVDSMLQLVHQYPDLRVRIFSGLEPDSLLRALEGAPAGTVIKR